MDKRGSPQHLCTVAAFFITNYARNEVLTRPRAQRKRIALEELSAFLAISDGDRITRKFPRACASATAGSSASSNSSVASIQSSK